MDRRGQLALPGAIGIVLVLVGIIVGGLVFSKIHAETERAVKGTGKTHIYETVNPEFTSDASRWENVVVADAAVNAWDSGGFVKVSTAENDAVVDIGEWKQKLTVTSLYDRVDLGIEKYAYSVLSVTGIGTGSIKVQLILHKPDTSRVVLHEITATTTVAWTAIENDVKPYITATGDYYIVMRAELLATSTTPSLVVGFDNAGLKVNAYELSTGERTAKDVGELGGTLFSILAVLALVGVIFALVWAFTRPGRE